MSSYLKLFQDFLQKKEHAVNTTASNNDEDIGTAEEPHISADTIQTEQTQKMEHSYMRDSTRPSAELITGLAPARTILVRRPPQCPSCHTHPLEEHDLEDNNQVTVPSYNEIASKEGMNECERIAKYVKNTNSDDEDWEARVNQIGWSNMQKTLFTKIVRILDNDQLARLALAGRQNEAMQRRVIVDKSAARMRRALASVSWDQRLTQWMHSLLMDFLPSSYMASYLDILQTLKTKLSTLMDKMLFSRPINVSQELLAPVMKKQWEPVTNIKTRKLTQKAVIVALPAMPTSGPIPNRLQKWYQHLATITQIVQVTLPTTSEHVARQPLEQVAEQIVSLARVKIQELRAEQPTRSIILIGFNAGAALAIQVAMSEQIACLVCMGFAYNTFNGVRGAPDDRILDIKIPILFVIGQNSARSSPEEIESLREKMISESSLVIVGSADDVLRVPKSRRKIENVTQAMVDAMVTDEVYEFIKKILNNPPGPRVPTGLNSNIVQPYKPMRSVGGNNNSDAANKIAFGPRKRKLENLLGDQAEQTPGGKMKYTVQQIGRPRTRPLNVPVTKPNRTPIGAMSQQKHNTSNMISNEDLNMAMQSILGDNSDQEASPSHNNSGDSQKSITSFDFMAQSKSLPGKPTILKQTIINPGVGGNANASTAIGTKIKMIPANQFVQLKPPIQSQSKIYTIKPSSVQQQQPKLGTIVSTSSNISNSGQQIFTLKSPNGQTTQYVTAAPAAAQQKYTVVKNAAGGTTLQLTSAVASGASTSASKSSVDISNIIDMPIIFADNDGNLSDAVGSPGHEMTKKADNIIKTSTGTSSNVGQLIISQKIIKEANSTNNTFIINKPTSTIQPITSTSTQAQPTKMNKVIFLNRNTMKPCGNIITRPTAITQNVPKYTKVVLANTKIGTAPTILTRPTTQINTNTTAAATSSVSTIKQVSLQKPNAATILNMNTKTLPQIQLVNSTNTNNANNTTTTTTTIGRVGERSQLRNIIVKPGGLKQIPLHLKTQLLNRSLTVRKLVNIVPVTKPATTNATEINQSANTTTESSSSSTSNVGNAIQTSPKIITLNPINPSTIND